jgi:hypothetical protein
MIKLLVVTALDRRRCAGNDAAGNPARSSGTDEERSTMMWFWSGAPSWGYAAATAGMALFWILVVFTAIVVVHHVGATGRTPVRNAPAERMATVTSLCERRRRAAPPGRARDLPVRGAVVELRTGS